MVTEAIEAHISGGEGPSGERRNISVDEGGRLVLRSSLYVTAQLRAPYGATSGAFDANDAVGNMMEFDVPKRGRIKSAKFVDQADQTSALTAHVYSKPFVAAASDAVYTIADADAVNWVTNITPTMVDEGGSQVAEVVNIDSDYYSEGGKLYVQLSTTGTPTMPQATMPLLQLYILPLGE
tara:strand:+ start:3147 stop:3686 length:540 start_codon:yes stop_codon:yes gene_type:complete